MQSRVSDDRSAHAVCLGVLKRKSACGRGAGVVPGVVPGLYRGSDGDDTCAELCRDGPFPRGGRPEVKSPHVATLGRGLGSVTISGEKPRYLNANVAGLAEGGVKAVVHERARGST